MATAIKSTPTEMVEPLTVVHVTWSLVAGGSETYALTLASNLDARRYRSVICAMDRGGALETEAAQRGIPFVVMDRRPGIDLILMVRLWRFFSRVRARIVHTHHFNQLFYSLIGALLIGARIVHTEHDVELYKQKRYRLLLRLMSLMCDRVIAVGDEVARVLRERVGIAAEKIRIIPAGVDLDRFCQSREESRRELGIAPSDAVIAMVARLSPEKNHALLLKAFAGVSRSVKGARMLLVGDGPCRSAIDQQITQLGLTDKIEVLGYRNDIPSILAACDVAVLSSDREGLPIAVLEAMAAKRPVIATAVGDLATVVKHGKTGYLIEPGDSLSLELRLIELLGDPDWSAQMGVNGWESINRDFSQRLMIERHQAVYAGRAE